MSAVVNGGGTGGAARIAVPDILMAGKTGTAQVRRITMAERRAGVRRDASLPFKLRDHALFIGYAPFDKPRYAVGTIIEHGGHMNRNEDAPMISGDVLTYLFDPAKALEKLDTLEKQWGGPPNQRLAEQMQTYRIEKGLDPAPPGSGNAAAVPAEDTGQEAAD